MAIRSQVSGGSHVFSISHFSFLFCVVSSLLMPTPLLSPIPTHTYRRPHTPHTHHPHAYCPRPRPMPTFDPPTPPPTYSLTVLPPTSQPCTHPPTRLPIPTSPMSPAPSAHLPPIYPLPTPTFDPPDQHPMPSKPLVRRDGCVDWIGLDWIGLDPSRSAVAATYENKEVCTRLLAGSPQDRTTVAIRSQVSGGSHVFSISHFSFLFSVVS